MNRVNEYFWPLLIGVCSLVNCEPVAQSVPSSSLASPSSPSSSSSSSSLSSQLDQYQDSNSNPILVDDNLKWTRSPSSPVPTYLETPFQLLLERLIQQQRLDQLSNDLEVNSALPGLLSAALVAQQPMTNSDNSYYYKRADTSPGWNKLHGGWGKRQPSLASSMLTSGGLVSGNLSPGQPSWTKLVDQREPVRRSGSWNHLNALWGRKRSAPAISDNSVDNELASAITIRAADRDWNSLNSMWGRRRRRGWNDLQGGWGKRASANWNQLNPMWGKRSV